MSYNSDFQIDFINRSLNIIQNYSGPNDATNLINCLLGLVIIPHRMCFDRNLKIYCPLEDMSLWGIPAEFAGTKTAQYNIAEYIRRLRNSISHGRFLPHPNHGEVSSFIFSNKDGSHFATISLAQLRLFAQRLVEHLKAT